MVRIFAVFWMLVFAHDAMAQTAFGPEVIKSVQQKLAGYFEGTADGNFGADTAKAIRQYQSDWKLPETGEISQDLIERLEQKHPATQPRWQKAENLDCEVWNQWPGAQETATWTGGCIGGKASGSGTMVRQYLRKDELRQETYEGELREGKLNGRGILKFEDGSVYVGELHDDKLDGRGVMTLANGDRYEGEFSHNKLSGHGVMTWANGNRYEGDYLDNARSAHGVFIWADGDRYEGEWLDDRPHGFGEKYDHARDQTFSGQWRAGCLRTGGMNLAIITSMKDCRF